MIKVTTVTRYGMVSQPIALEVNEHGYAEVPDVRGIVAYNIYVPMVGYENSGPWYLAKEVKYRHAKQARFTLAAVFNDVPFCSETNWANVRNYCAFLRLPRDMTPAAQVALFDFPEFFDHAQEIE